MPSQLTSVRLDEKSLDALRLVAEMQGESVAETIRRAINEYVRKEFSVADVKASLERAHAQRLEHLEAFALQNDMTTTGSDKAVDDDARGRKK